MSSTITQALQRLAGSTAPIWLVQCNPRRSDILASSRTALPDTWCVRRHTKEIRCGDRIVLWLSGADAGVYALGEITADVRPVLPVAGDGAGPSSVTKASVNFFLNLVDRPIKRSVLKTDPRFADEPILRQPFAANPHRLSPIALEAILERVDRSG